LEVSAFIIQFLFYYGKRKMRKKGGDNERIKKVRKMDTHYNPK
jgi:hypothetical protein